jgi:FkbM family methyltransferase
MTMKMISYGQNREDVVLSRVFPPDYVGFYVDIGANDPVGCSVTCHFYHRGWSGVNVEPAGIFERLRQHRPRDINVNVGISRAPGRAMLFDYPAAPGNSTLSPAVARDHKSYPITCVPKEIELITLAQLCERYVGDRTIDFMSIDVEGHEEDVIAGGAWDRFRPRVLVIEATWPLSRRPSHEGWEPLVLAHGYHFALFDGLNRFYVREEDLELREPLAAPVCIFDKYVPYEHVLDLHQYCAALSSHRALVLQHLKLLVGKILRKESPLEALVRHGVTSLRESGDSQSGSGPHSPGGPVPQQDSSGMRKHVA